MARVDNNIGWGDHRPVGAPEKKSLDEPDEVRQFELGSLRMVKVGSQVIGRGTMQPGWRYSTHMSPTMGGQKSSFRRWRAASRMGRNFRSRRSGRATSKGSIDPSR